MGKIFSVKDNSDAIEDKKRKEFIKYYASNSQGVERNTLMIDFSPRLIAFILLILGFIFFSNQLFSIIMFLFLGFVVMSSVRPVVNWFIKKGISKGWAVAISYAVFFLIILTVLVVILVPLANQLTGLVSEIPKWINEYSVYLEDFSIAGINIDVDTMNKYVTDFVKSFPTADNFKNVAGFLSSFFSVSAFLLTSLVFSVYLVSEHDSFFDILLIRISSDEKRDRVKKLVMDVERKLGSWVLGQAFVSSLSAFYSGMIMFFLGVPFALPLAILTGLLGVIPNLGTTLAGLMMALVTLITVGPVQALIILGAFILYQPLENNFITPKIMGNAVGLKPIIVMLGVIVFLIMFGVVGGFVAVPLMVVMKILYEFYIDLQKLKAKGIV